MIRSGTRGIVASSLPTWTPRRPGEQKLIGVLPGEGIGPETIAAALDVLSALSEATEIHFRIRTGGAIGGAALKASGRALSQEVQTFCADVFGEGGAILCGPGDGRFVYELRAAFDLYCKVVPLQPLLSLSDVGPLRPQIVESADVLVVRENTGGLYFGEASESRTPSGARVLSHQVRYDSDQVDRIARVAIALSARRRGKLSIVLKANGIPAMSALWAERLDGLTQGSGLSVEVLEVDHAAYRLVFDPQSFDVVLAPNAFGDIVADVGALLLASRGLSHSGNFGEGGIAVYQTGHGSAHDLAGRDRANPIGQIRSLGMLLSESFGLVELEVAIEEAIAAVLADRFRTPDIAGPEAKIVGTRDLGHRIAAAAFERALLNRGAKADATRISGGDLRAA